MSLPERLPKWSAAYVPAVGEAFLSEAVYFPRLDGARQAEVRPGTVLRVIGFEVENGFMYAVCRGRLVPRAGAEPREFTVYVAGIDVMAWRRGAAQLSPEKLEDGRRYRQMYPVTNPELDRREKYAVRAVRWHQGATWRAHVKRGPSDVTGPTVELSPVEVGDTKSGYIGPGHTGWRQLVASLELVPEGAADILYRVAQLDERSSARCFMNIIQRMMDAGAVSPAQLETAAIAWADDPENN